MKTIPVIVALAAALALASCQFVGMTFISGNGVSAETPIEVGAFSSISSRGSIHVFYSQTEGEPSVILTCDENLIEYYQIEVEGNTLVIKTKPGVNLSHRVESFVTVKSPEIEGISVSGSGQYRITGPVASDGDVDLRVSGSGDIYADGTVSCRDFSSGVSGSGSVNLGGVLAESARFKGTGSGATRVECITADYISATLSGSGSLSLVCKDAGDINISLSGSGSAHLSGNARSLNSRTSGSGRVDSRNLSL